MRSSDLNREAYRLGNERKRNDNPGEDVSARRSHTAEPFLAVTGNMFGHRNRESATRYPARERAGEMNVRDVARRCGGQAQIGRASCRERVGQYVSHGVGAGSLKKKNP